MSVYFTVLCREITVTPANKQIVINTGTGPLTAILTEGTFFLSSTSRADSILKNIVDAFNVAHGSSIFSAAITVDNDADRSAGGLDVSAYINTTAGVWQIEWGNASTTFDPAEIGMDSNGVTVVSSVVSIFHRITATHTPISVFFPDVPSADYDDTYTVADVQAHRSPSNARSFFVVADKEERFRLSWQYVLRERVHPEKTHLNFAGERWGCLHHWWASNTWRGGRFQLFAKASTPLNLSFNSDFIGEYVFMSLPGELPATRPTQGQELYNVGPFDLVPYV